jgi:hypothetical protein
MTIVLTGGTITATLDDIDILDVGNTIQLGGAIWTGNGKVYVTPLPGENLDGEEVTLLMNEAEWERFLNQSDVQDVRGPGKAILRKSQRLIDQRMAWNVFERDDYRCRYCGKKGPLTVDHIIQWENGGATVPDNLLACCRNCNKTRGNLDYFTWIGSPMYDNVSLDGLDPAVHQKNLDVVARLAELRKIVAKPRSR